MSIWAHVVGAVRIDGLPGVFEEDAVEDIERRLGPMCLWDTEGLRWNEKSTLPRGSEGSLQYKVLEYNGGLPWVIIPIWGDLRDVDNVTEISKWWHATIPKLGFIRDAVLSVSIRGVITTLTYEERREEEDHDQSI